MNATRTLALGLLALAALLTCGPSARAQAKGSAKAVKASARGTKSGGKTTVTITLEVDPKYHIYANPIGNKDLESSQTVVKITAGGKPVEAKVAYPEGELKKDKTVGDYRVYKGKVTIKAVVSSEAALEAAVQVQACTPGGVCLLPATIKLKVD